MPTAPCLDCEAYSPKTIPKMARHSPRTVIAFVNMRQAW